jgi:hypothetical protein
MMNRISQLSCLLLWLGLTSICLAESPSADSAAFRMDMRNVGATSADSASFTCTPVNDMNDYSPSFQMDLRSSSPAFADSEPFQSDATVDMQDMVTFAFQWLAEECQSSGRCAGADLNGDSAIDFRDFALFASHWLQTAP